MENVPLAVFGVPDVAGRDPHVLCARREDFLQEGLHQVSKNYMKHQQIKSNELKPKFTINNLLFIACVKVLPFKYHKIVQI